MAGSKLTHNASLRASTMLEVIIAMVLIVVVFGIAMMIYANITQSSLSVKRIKAEAVLKAYLQNAEKTKDNTTQSFTADDLRIEQEVKSYDNERDLFEIDLIAYYGNEQKVAELRKVIINSNE